jgi:hypothetical protein
MYADQALRCVVFSAAFACIALDRALEPLQFSEEPARKLAIANGIAFGDSGDGTVIKSVRTVLDVVGEHVHNGKAVAAQVRAFFEKLPTALRADILAEYFGPEERSQSLFKIAREFDRYAFRNLGVPLELSVEARSTLGVLADFCSLDRRLLLPVLTPPELPKETPGPEASLTTATTDTKVQNKAQDNLL